MTAVEALYERFRTLRLDAGAGAIDDGDLAAAEQEAFETVVGDLVADDQQARAAA